MNMSASLRFCYLLIAVMTYSQALCPAPENGVLHCNGVTTLSAFAEDRCTFSCNQGYELQGPQFGTCFTLDTWSRGLPTCAPLNCPDRIAISNDTFVQLRRCDLTYLSQCRLYCREGLIGDDVIYLCNVTSDPGVFDWVPIGGVHAFCERVRCPAPTNGLFQCTNEDTGMAGSNCTFSCNPGYELQGIQNGTCLANHTWSEGLPSCVPLNCPNRISLDNREVSLVGSSCRLYHGERCRLSCREGYDGDDVVYLCNVTSDPAVVDWVPIGGVHHGLCKKVQCPVLQNGLLWCPNGANGTYGDACTFSCNPGYELQGPQSGYCLADRTWSRGSSSCVPLNCPDRISTTDGIVHLQTCPLTYLSRCKISCPDGFIGDGVTYLCNVTSDSTVVGWTLNHSACERDTKETGSIPYGAIAGGVSGVVAVLAITVVCIILIVKTPCKRKYDRDNCQGTCSTTITQTQPPVQPYPVHNEIKESSLMDNVPTPPYNVYIPAEYETAEQSKQKEMDEYYLDMNAAKEHATEQPPEYDTIRDYYEKPAYENWNRVCPGSLPTRDGGDSQYY
ncbi:P-selectin-like isoform X2 [Dysidea avara]|uniref:P-selectin-like isoform X2 n=1 Tax=Dysidea avara TaxID=196820 RepID=UPI003318A680